MARVTLIGGAYQSRSLIASAQVQINLYGEANPPDSQAPVPVTLYLTPGLTLEAAPPNVEGMRSIYAATNGDVYCVVGPQVYYIDNTFTFHLLGTIPDKATPVSFSDNGIVVVLVDGSKTGYCIDITPTSISNLPVPRTWGVIADANFLGSNFVDYIDTFFVFNQPGTFNLYLSLSEVSFADLTQTAIGTGSITDAGTGYTVGNYTGVPLTGGAGSDATADITVTGGLPSAGTLVSGSLYTNGVYANVPMTGGTGTGFTATVTVAGGAVTSAVPEPANLGLDYIVGDVLSAADSSIGGTGSGFTWTVTTTTGAVTGFTLDDPGQGYAVGDVLSAAAANIGGTGAGFTWTVATMEPAFDPLAIAAKSGSADIIERVTVVFRTVWPIGRLTSEAWIDTGAADFPLQPLPGVFVEHGCIAPFSVANFDRSSFWLSQDRQGRAVVVKTQGYNAVEISTHAIVTIIQGFATISDAIGFTFQQEGHVFYVLTFPSANATYAVDIQTGQWFQWAYTDNNGNLNRHRANCCCFGYGLNLVGDWQNGNLYSLDPNNYTDNGQPIQRIRSFPHLIQDGKRATYLSFIADLQVGTDLGVTASNPPMVSLRWSDDRGATYGNAVEQSMGAGGQYLTSIKFNRLGMARDRVFELSWSAATNTSLNGAFVEMLPHRS